ncbi:MAG: ABC transporter permease [Vicinamibacterales bacterium]
MPETAVTLPLAGAGDRRKDTWTIEPQRAGLIPRLKEFIRYRRITWFLASRSVKRMYQGTALGKFWLFARPLFPILLSGMIFGSVVGVDSGEVPYLLFFLTGAVTWNVFERCVIFITKSMNSSRDLVRKVYFPRLVIPVSGLGPAMVYLFIYCTLYLLGITFYLIAHHRWYLRMDLGLLMAPVALLLAITCAISIGLWTCVLQTRARDVQMGIRYVMRFWFYLTPVIYPVSMVPENYRHLVYLNPMAGFIEAFKWATIGAGSELNPMALGISTGVMLVVLTGGLIYFDRMEGSSVDQL